MKRISSYSPWLLLVVLIAAWDFFARRQEVALMPRPWEVVLGIGELAQRGLLAKYVVASVFRVTWGYLLAVVLAIPVGLLLGWNRRLEMSLNPLVQILRPISPLAWIPIAILWFGVGDWSAIYLIFLASFLPLLVGMMNAVRNVPEVHVNAGRNFGLSETAILVRVVLPSILPQLVAALRITLGVAWLVVVAAEMIAVNSGLGFLIIDARNAGNRYDLVVAGMAMIGLIGLLLDVAMRSLERATGARLGYEGR